MSNLCGTESNSLSFRKRLDDLSKILNEDDVLRRLPSRLGSDVEFSDDDDEEEEDKFIISSGLDVTPEVHGIFSQSSEGNNSVSDSDSRDLRELHEKPKQTSTSESISKVSSCGHSFPKPSAKPQMLDFDSVYKSTLKRISELGCKKKSSTSTVCADSKEISERRSDQSKVCQNVSQKQNEQIASSSATLSSTQKVVNNKTYSVLSYLGKGASCTVHAAYDRENQMIVAIKCVNLCEADVAVKDGYMKEIEYLKMLQGSDHVIKMYDYQFTNDNLYLVLEKGDTDLAHYLADEKTKKDLDPIMIKFYWAQMLKAVADIHKHGIIHSDLKPANFLLVSGHLKLIDFGIAASVPADMTSVLRDTQVGTVNYMSPEAINSYTSPDQTDFKSAYKLSVKADVWSLGCILYYMIYGRCPFQHITSLFEKVTAIVSPLYEIPYPPAKDPSAIPVLKLCLERNVKKRASVEELLSHAYLQKESEDKTPEDLQKMMAQIQLLTPRRISAISGVVERLTQQNR